MELFAIYTAWWNWAATLQAEAENAEAVAASELAYIKATKLVESWEGSPSKTATAAKAERDTDEDVERAEQTLITAKSERKMFGVAYDNCERSSNLISREITRRTGGTARILQGRMDRMTP